MPRPGPHQNSRYLPVRAILNRHNPMNLIAIGAPEDEYDSEIAEILDALADAPSPESLAPILAEIFRRWFGDNVPFSDWPALADDLLTDAR